MLLTESPAGSAKFVGSIGTTTAASSNGDALLSVVEGDTITVTYLDADDGNGGSNIPRTDTAAVECTPPIITNVQITDIQGTTAMVRWTTNEPADSVVDFGFAATPPPSQTASSPNLVTIHAILLTGLVPCNDYIVKVTSTDAQGNTATDDNDGDYYSFNSGTSASPTFTASNTPVPVPTQSATPNIANITVPDNKPLVDVNVKINMNHTYDGDTVISVRHPDGTIVTLSNRRGGSGDNFINTVFDDQASGSITTGVAPFTGSYIPEQPLSALNGKNAAGTWQVQVLDNVSGDGGTLTSAQITLRYPVQACGPKAEVDSGTAVSDACATGGSGNGNGFIDDGEVVTFSVTVGNTGTTSLSGVSARLSSLNPAVTLTDDAASYADIAAGASGVSQSPHFSAQVYPGYACGSPLSSQSRFGPTKEPSSTALLWEAPAKCSPEQEWLCSRTLQAASPPVGQ